MRKIKFSYQQLMDVLAMHLESLTVLRRDEHVSITPFQLDKNGNITVFIHKNKMEDD